VITIITEEHTSVGQIPDSLNKSRTNTTITCQSLCSRSLCSLFNANLLLASSFHHWPASTFNILNSVTGIIRLFFILSKTAQPIVCT